MTDAIDICGLVVLFQPARLGDVCSRLNSIPGLIIHANDHKGRMAVTIENHHKTPQASVPDKMEAVRTIPGVIDISLAYTHCEKAGDMTGYHKTRNCQ